MVPKWQVSRAEYKYIRSNNYIINIEVFIGSYESIQAIN